MRVEKKFITVNGVLQRNPAWRDPNAAHSATPASTVASPAQALTIVTSPDDAIDASALLKQPVPASTAATIEIIQDEAIISQLNVNDGSVLLDGLSKIFAQHEVPVGLLNKLLMLNDYALNFKIDDSGSMQNTTDSTVKDASSRHMMEKFAKAQRRSDSSMTRWEEAEDRLHVFIEMLAYVPSGPITFTFLNRQDTLVLDRTNKKTPEQFLADAHEKISALFVIQPSGNTPMLRNLKNMFAQSSKKTMHYVLTDGVPSDGTAKDVAKLVLERTNPQDNPLTFLSCTNEDSQAEWMKNIEEIAPFTAELDDFGDERKEVLKDQGSTFPYSKGFWLLGNLVAAINPDDLDALDESAPFTMGTMENLMGRALSQQEYDAYFGQHPAINTRVQVQDPLLATYKTHFAQNYPQFCRKDIVSGQIPCVQAYREEMRRQTIKNSPFAQMLPSAPSGYTASPQAMFGGGYSQPAAQPGATAAGTNYRV
ncbi:MAG: hypothetical protein A3F13_00825 [Gammaproteobacteria bacterium RIFCSPHIGHO2_12_FULL_40_19]|nr:MAG: hypothetical protein A3F13_00825 [Gammaproteobacteria bacterium RIFCSPHIGHO2_12_FULL_40_19]